MKDWSDEDISVPVPERLTSAPAAEVTGERLVRERLVRLAEAVEKLGEETVETTTATETSELDLMVSGLEPDQEIRDRGLVRAVDMLRIPDITVVLDRGDVGLWELADQCAAYIRDGSKP